MRWIALRAGGDHAVRKRVARQIIKCARSGKTTLDEVDRRRNTALRRLGLII
jgi:hypothetical protein